MARPIFFQCPITRLGAQSVLVAEPRDDVKLQVEAISCSVCRRVHIVDVKTGQLLPSHEFQPIVRYGVA